MSTFVTIVSVCAGLISITTVLIALYKITRFFDGIKDSDRARKAENGIIIRAVFASLNGLIQLGADGDVTKSRDDLSDYLVDHRD